MNAVGVGLGVELGALRVLEDGVHHPDVHQQPFGLRPRVRHPAVEVPPPVDDGHLRRRGLVRRPPGSGRAAEDHAGQDRATNAGHTVPPVGPWCTVRIRAGRGRRSLPSGNRPPPAPRSSGSRGRRSRSAGRCGGTRSGGPAWRRRNRPCTRRSAGRRAAAARPRPCRVSHRCPSGDTRSVARSPSSSRVPIATPGGTGPVIRLPSISPSPPPANFRWIRAWSSPAMAGLTRASLAAQVFDLADQVPEGVEQVDQRLVHEQPRHLREVRLGGVRGRAAAVAGPPEERRLHHPAEVARVEDPLRLAVPRLPPPVLVDQQADPRRLARLTHRHAVGRGRGHRLLADDVRSAGRPPGGSGRGATRAGWRRPRSPAARGRAPRRPTRRRCGRRARSANARAFPGTASATATSSAPGTRRHASAWNPAKYPAPISTPLRGGAVMGSPRGRGSVVG